MTELWVCIGYCCNKYPIVVYDVFSEEQKVQLMKDFNAKYKNIWSSLDEDFPGIEFQIYSITEEKYIKYFDEKITGCCHPTIYFIKKDKYTINQLVNSIRNDNC